MRAICLHEKQRIAAFFETLPQLHVYSVGDLDDFFWPYTQWYGLETDGEPGTAELRQVALLYGGVTPPVLLALTEQPDEMGELLRGIGPLLPRRLYSHLSDGVLETIADLYAAESHGTFYKMVLANPAQLDHIDITEAVQLGVADLAELDALYTAAYPGNAFDPRMLETGQYFGVRRDGQLVCVAGIHVYSPAYGVAALGNITTLPAQRGRGLAKVATAALCRSLLARVRHIGLNVNAANAAAVSVYRQLGFEPLAIYHEAMLEQR